MNNKQSIGAWLACVCTVIFIVLKLTKVIAWSWWAVWAPLIGYVAFVVILYIAISIVLWKSTK